MVREPRSASTRAGAHGRRHEEVDLYVDVERLGVPAPRFPDADSPRRTVEAGALEGLFEGRDLAETARVQGQIGVGGVLGHAELRGARV